MANVIPDSGTQDVCHSSLPEGPCHAVTECHPLLPAIHVADGTNVVYNSNPPSSGPHYPVWAAYQEFLLPVDRRHYVHNLEHGAVVLLYRCPDSISPECHALETQLRAVFDALPTDSLCSTVGVRVRAVLIPDPLLDVPVAAAAWGWTYKAQCVDQTTILNFAAAHYGQGPEEVCANGATTF